MDNVQTVYSSFGRNVDRTLSNLMEPEGRDIVERILSYHLRKKGPGEAIRIAFADRDGTIEDLVKMDVLTDLLIEEADKSPKKERNRIYKMAESISSKVHGSLKNYILQEMLNEEYLQDHDYFYSVSGEERKIPLSQIDPPFVSNNILAKLYDRFDDLVIDLEEAAKIRDTKALFFGLIELDDVAFDMLLGYSTIDERRNWNRYFNEKRQGIRDLYFQAEK